MKVKEFLDKQLEWTPIVLVSEECDCKEYEYIEKTVPYIKGLEYRDSIYDIYGDREVEYFKHFLDPINRIILAIKLVKNAQ